MSSAAAPRSPATASSQSTRQLLDELDALMQRMLALPVNQPEEEGPAEPAPAISSVAGVCDPGPAAQRPATANLIVTVSHAAAPSCPQPPAVEFRAAPADTQPQHEVISGRVVVPHRGDEPRGSLEPPHRSEPVVQPEPEPLPPALRYQPEDNPPPVRVHKPAPRPESSPLDAWLPRPIAPAPPPPEEPTLVRPRPAPVVEEQDLGEVELLPEETGPLLRPLVACNRAFDRFTTVFGPLGRLFRSRFGRHTLGWVGLGLWGAAAVLAAVRWLG